MAVYIGLPILAKIAIGLSLIGGRNTTINETTSINVMTPVVEPLPSATNSAMISIYGFSEKDRKILVLVNGREEATTDTGKEEKFKFNNIKLSEGENKIEVVAKYQDKRSTATEFFITYKKEPPKLEIAEPTDGQTIMGEAKINITGSTDSGNKVSINDRLVIVDRNGNFTYPITLSAGENIFNFKAEDDAGNSKQLEIKVNYSP
ncbi:hypothetical protein A3I51_06130 [Candidatus Gottesmanbacteria bacterium RIFCSPLOWO2_02_FULL_38_8]|nr:MAG: hypothetical protein A3I51_06130 [Candidatus Gottesmanbacteria bacterium RIFCSPLOWO2_02_FULL_38_8]